jgi:replicative DNA helicase
VGDFQDKRAGDPPADVESEKTLLAAMLKSKEAVADVVDVLRGSDFHRTGHGLIYEAIVGLYAEYEEINIPAVVKTLQKRKQLKAAGGADYLLALAEHATATKDRSRLARRIRSAAVLRQLMSTAQTVYARAAETGLDAVDEVANFAQTQFRAATRRRHAAEPPTSLSAILEGALDDMEEATTRPLGIATGIEDLDALTGGGLRAGQLIVIASRPSVGKTNLALNLLRHASLRLDIPSALFTLESERKDIAMRILAAEARLELHHVRSGAMTDAEWTRAADRLKDVVNAPLFVQDAQYTTFLDIRAECRELADVHDMRFVVVDSLHMLTYGTRPFASRYEEVSEIARCLKLLAKELQIPVVAVSTLNRGPEQRTDRRPMLSDLRDSGALEDNADLVILLHRDDLYDRQSPRAGEADLIVAKHREGPTATITTAYQGHYARFVDMRAS